MFDNLKKRFSSAFAKQEEGVIRRVDLEDKIREILLEADVSFESSEEIISDLNTRLGDVKKKIDYDFVKEKLRESIRHFLEESNGKGSILEAGKKPYVILFLGINGTGKTTTIAKIANYLKNNGKRVVISASDTFRAGAIEQISILGERLGINVIKHTAKSDPSSVAFDAIEHAKARNIDYVLIDSAGRMQTNKNLLDEMKKIKRVSKPDLTVLVLDSMIGQDAIHQAETFMKEITFDAVILTKLDTDARGGAILTISTELKKPILFVGVGQEFEDILEFTPDWYIERILP